MFHKRSIVRRFSGEIFTQQQQQQQRCDDDKKKNINNKEDDDNDDLDSYSGSSSDDSSLSTLLSTRSSFLEDDEQEEERELSEEDFINKHFEFRNLLLKRLSKEGNNKTSKEMLLLFNNETIFRNDIMNLLSSSSPPSSTIKTMEKDDDDNNNNNEKEDENDDNNKQLGSSGSINKKVVEAKRGEDMAGKEKVKEEAVRKEQHQEQSRFTTHQSDNITSEAIITEETTGIVAAERRRRRRTGRCLSSLLSMNLFYMMSFLYNQIMFDMNYALPGYIAMFVYCLAHISIYMILETLINEGFKNYDTEEDGDYVLDLVHLFLLVIGLVLSRLSGEIWYWIKDEKFMVVKQYMEQQQQQQQQTTSSTSTNNKSKDSTKTSTSTKSTPPWDAKLLRWFKHHTRTKNLVDFVSLYLVYVSLYHFMTARVVSVCLDQKYTIIPNLPSIKAGVDTTLSQLLLPILAQSNNTNTNNTSTTVSVADVDDTVQSSYNDDIPILNDNTCTSKIIEDYYSIIFNNDTCSYDDVNLDSSGEFFVKNHNDDDNIVLEQETTTDDNNSKSGDVLDVDYYLQEDYKYLYSSMTVTSYSTLLTYGDAAFVPPVTLFFFNIVWVFISICIFTKMTRLNFWTF